MSQLTPAQVMQRLVVSGRCLVFGVQRLTISSRSRLSSQTVPLRAQVKRSTQTYSSCVSPSPPPRVLLLLAIRQAVKGAAASFGIVTEFVVRTQPEPSVTTQYSYNIQCVPPPVRAPGWICGVVTLTPFLGRLGKHADMASTFARWQGMISDPNLTRKLASQVIIFEFGMVITGEDEDRCRLAARHMNPPLHSSHINRNVLWPEKRV